LVHLATGDLLRQEIADDTALGAEAKRYVTAGELVPDEVVIGMIRGRLAGSADDFLLDGFPRTVAQADALDAMLTELDAPLDAVLSLLVPTGELVRRLGGRWLCRACGRSYHEVFNPHTPEDVCEATGVAGGCDLYQRDDDGPETVAARLETYETQTSPVVDYFRSRGLLREVDGTGEPGAVYRRLLGALGR
jgi:adenylate kinase